MSMIELPPRMRTASEGGSTPSFSGLLVQTMGGSLQTIRIGLITIIYTTPNNCLESDYVSIILQSVQRHLKAQRRNQPTPPARTAP
jgi:hypothetical protein